MVHQYQKVCCVSHHSLKSMDEIPRDRQLLLELDKAVNGPAVFASLCKEDQDESCQSLQGDFQWTTGVNNSNQTIRNRPDYCQTG